MNLVSVSGGGGKQHMHQTAYSGGGTTGLGGVVGMSSMGVGVGVATSAKLMSRIPGRDDDDRHHDRAMDLENDDAVNAAHSDDCEAEGDGDGDGDDVEVLPNGKRKRPMSVS